MAVLLRVYAPPPPGPAPLASLRFLGERSPSARYSACVLSLLVTSRALVSAPRDFRLCVESCRAGGRARTRDGEISRGFFFEQRRPVVLEMISSNV